MIGTLAIASGIAPSVLWREDAADLATMIDVLREQADRG